MDLTKLRIKVFADEALVENIQIILSSHSVSGITTNPSLIANTGLKSYRQYAQTLLGLCSKLPVCFEVLADDFAKMESQAMEIASWGENVYVKIPIMLSSGQQTLDLLNKLSSRGVKLNATCIMTYNQICSAADSMRDCKSGYISIFAGRIADTGINPVPMFKKARKVLAAHPNLKLIWASSREILNVKQAEEADCDVITLTYPLIKKLSLIGKDLALYSLETVQQFVGDARKIEF